MLVCIPTEGNAGLQEKISEHFGSSPYFTLYDSETEELKSVVNRNAHHAHGTCHPMNHLTKYKIDCIVCNHMGRRAIEALATEGIKVLSADSQNVNEVITKIKNDELKEIDPSKACRGHGQRKDLSTDIGVIQQGRGSGFGQGLGGGQGRGDGQGQGRCQHHEGDN